MKTKAFRKESEDKLKGWGTNTSFFLTKDMFHSGRENIQQYLVPKTDRHNLPKHADPHDKFVLASKKDCFQAF